MRRHSKMRLPMLCAVFAVAGSFVAGVTPKAAYAATESVERVQSSLLHHPLTMTVAYLAAALLVAALVCALGHMREVADSH